MARNPELDHASAILENELPLESSTARMLEISRKLTAAYDEGLQRSTASMLASHIYHLPSGYEKGYFLAVDLGGSTLRVALVHLEGHKDAVRRGSVLDIDHPKPMSIVEIKSWSGAHVDQLKTLTGDAFFDWIAVRIGEVVVDKFGSKNAHCLPMGLSWSFPIENTSIDSGKVQGMGKGFCVAEGLLGTDLKSHFTNAFSRQGLTITLEALINDSLAALLSHAYVAPATRSALILGTGTNAAVSLPLSMLPSSKLHSNRPSGAEEVLLNTELSMYGTDIYPITKWDEALDAAMPRPGFQPLEYLIGGGYMGEIGRRIIVDFYQEEKILGEIPEIWRTPYSLPTEVLAIMEELPQDDMILTYHDIHHTLPLLKLTTADKRSLQLVAYHVSSRAATYCAIALHAMVQFREKGAKNLSSNPTNNIVPIAFVGSVMEKYPRLLKRTQQALDKLTGWTPGSDDNHMRIILEFAPESAIFGAAVAVAAALEKKTGTATSPVLVAPTSLPQTERSSNASTLLPTSQGLEEENKSLDSGMSRKLPKNHSLQDPPFDGADEADGSPPLRQPFWLRFKTFLHTVFRKVFTKKRQG
ncbi:Hexokinase-1 [Dactylellina cionopaga]|nr:Hexokinase-1 [Dactylellina cionopaga]